MGRMLIDRRGLSHRGHTDSSALDDLYEITCACSRSGCGFRVLWYADCLSNDQSKRVWIGFPVLFYAWDHSLREAFGEYVLPFLGRDGQIMCTDQVCISLKNPWTVGSIITGKTVIFIEITSDQCCVQTNVRSCVSASAATEPRWIFPASTRRRQF